MSAAGSELIRVARDGLVDVVLKCIDEGVDINCHFDGDDDHEKLIFTGFYSFIYFLARPLTHHLL